MSDQTTNALLAIGLGTLAALVLLVPTAAVQYRLDGRLGPRDLAVLIGAAIYVVALWTYTLLPVPAGHYRCHLPQERPFATIGLIGPAPGGGIRAFLAEPAFLQVILNVLLFAPLGWFLRVILRRGVVVSTLVGFGVSLLIEMTQRTGDWGIYACAYRRFDVDDLIVNTLGATIGSLLSLLVVRRRSGAAPPLPTTITLGRRLVAMACDGVFVVVLGAAVALAWRGLTRYLLHTGQQHEVELALQWLVPFAVEAACVLGLGRTVGELVVSIRAVARSRAVTAPSRAVKLAAGIGPVFVLGLVRFPGHTWLLLGYLVATLAAVVLTPAHRGMSHALAGMRLEITAGDDL